MYMSECFCGETRAVVIVNNAPPNVLYVPRRLVPGDTPVTISLHIYGYKSLSANAFEPYL